MGLTDVFGKEDRVQMTFSQFHSLVKEATKAELLMNGIKCGVPNRYMHQMATGEADVFIAKIPDISEM